MIVSVCGFGSTGSSAVSDYISEFSTVQVFDAIEFDLVYRPDGLYDLYNHIMYSQDRTYSASFAIDRFKKMLEYHIFDYYSSGDKEKKKKIKLLFNSFIEEIKFTEWNGYQNPHYCSVKSFFQGLLLGRFFKQVEKNGKYPLSKIVLCKREDGLMDSFRNLVHNLLLILGCDFSKTLVLDQAFSGNNPQASFPFFDSPVAIVVDRDPRDLYIFANEVLKKKRFFKNTVFMPTNSVDDFIKYYKLIRQNQPYLKKDVRVLRISFEDMVYKYEETTTKVRDFCCLRDEDRKGIQFDPNMSIANTQLFRRFGKYKKDIERIEKELSDYIYHFPYSNIDKCKNDMFCGKSPLRGAK